MGERRQVLYCIDAVVCYLLTLDDAKSFKFRNSGFMFSSAAILDCTGTQAPSSRSRPLHVTSQERSLRFAFHCPFMRVPLVMEINKFIHNEMFDAVKNTRN